MLHAVKRQVGRVQQPIRSSPNAEFSDLKQRLHSVKQSLQYTSKMLSSANRGWIIQMQEQRAFSERFHESYPTTDDEIFQVAQKFAEGSQTLYDKFTREAETDITAYNEIHKQVQIYIREIERVESMYSRLADAKSESTRYQSKLDWMERSRRPTDESKKLRNLQKMDHQRIAYKTLLEETIKEQKSTYAKHPIVFKAALTSYWLSHEKHVTSLVQSLENTQTFAKQAEQEMRALDISAWKPPALQILDAARAINYNMSEAPETKNETEVFEDTLSTIGDEKTPTSPVITVESPTNVVDTLAGDVSITRKVTIKHAESPENVPQAAA